MLFVLVTEEYNAALNPSHIVIGPEGITDTDKFGSTVMTVVTVLSHPLDAVNTSV